MEQVIVAAKTDRRHLELAETLDPHLRKRVDQNIGHGRIGQQHLEWAEAHDLVEDAANNDIALRPRKCELLGRQLLRHYHRQALTNLSAPHLAELYVIDAIKHPIVDLRSDLLELAARATRLR